MCNWLQLGVIAVIAMACLRNNYVACANFTQKQLEGNTVENCCGTGEIYDPINPNGTVLKTADIKDLTDPNGISEESRKKQGRNPMQGMMQNVMPIMIIPFLISSGIVPIMLLVIKKLILKTFFIGLIAAGLTLLNMIRRNNMEGGVYHHVVKAKY